MRTKKQIDLERKTEVRSHFIQVPEYLWTSFKIAVAISGQKSLKAGIFKMMREFCEIHLIHKNATKKEIAKFWNDRQHYSNDLTKEVNK